MKGWLDKYGKELNANEGHSSAPKEWRGEGYSNVGRNYSPAWGGQFEDGGEIPKAQKGKRTPIYTEDPKKIQSYNDSLNLFKAYQFQKNNYKPGYEAWLDDVSKSYPGGKEELRKIREKNLGKPGSIYKDKRGLNDGWKDKDSDYDPLDSTEKPIVNYYKSLIGNNPNFRIGKHSSPDLWHKTIKPIASYYDGAASPVYKEPVQPYLLKGEGWRDFDGRGGNWIDDDNYIYTDQDPQADNYKKKPQKPKPEPSLKKKVTKAELLKSSKANTPGITELQHSDVQLPPVQQGKYRVEYYDPSLGEETHRKFMTQAESDAYTNELSKRNLNGTPSAGNITQRVEYQLGGNVYPVNYVPQAQDGITSEDSMLNNIYSKWPALKKLGDVSIKADESFTRDRTGVGDIEFFSPNTPQVTYSNGYVVQNPSAEGYGILYNPSTNDEQNIRLDMLHGMAEADPRYRRLRNRFERAVGHTDIKDEMNHWYNIDKEKGNAEDGREKWIDNYTDGQLRTLLYEGDRSKQNYSDEEANQLLSHPRVKRKFNKLNNYLQKGEFGSSLPGSVGFTYARTQNPAPSEGPYAKKTLPSAQNGQEMSYYQHGLDWKPKSISRNGGWLEKYVPQAQVGITVPYESADNSSGVPISIVPKVDESSSESVPSGFNYEDYYSKANKYLSRPIFKNTELKPEHIAKSAKEFYEKTGYEYPLDLLLTQAQMETGLGTKLKSKYNYFNVGNTDSGAVKNYDTPEQSLLEYMGVMYNDYLDKGKKKVSDLLKPKGFVNYAGNRYASAADYENKLLSQKDFISKKLLLKKGGVIEDDRGQWAHPGEITKINSNQITMKGVDYPVLGISDAGDRQMMYPGEEYTFKGKTVTEYPQKKKNGGWLDKYN